MTIVLIHLAECPRFHALLAALRAAGAYAATIHDNSEMAVVFWRGLRACLQRPANAGPTWGKTVTSLVPNPLVARVVAAAERVLGGLEGPAATGLVPSWEVGHCGIFRGDVGAGQLVGGHA